MRSGTPLTPPLYDSSALFTTSTSSETPKSGTQMTIWGGAFLFFSSLFWGHARQARERARVCAGGGKRQYTLAIGRRTCARAHWLCRYVSMSRVSRSLARSLYLAKLP
jgi:hypothetical protein